MLMYVGGAVLLRNFPFTVYSGEISTYLFNGIKRMEAATKKAYEERPRWRWAWRGSALSVAMEQWQAQ